MISGAYSAKGFTWICLDGDGPEDDLSVFSGTGKIRLNGRTVRLTGPVVSIGIPTVVDAATLAVDLLEEAGVEHVDGDKLRGNRQNMMVTPQDIDQQVRDLSKVVGYGINWALQDLEIEEINALLS